IRGCTHPRHRRLVPGLASPPSRRRRETSVERTALAHAPCGVCVKLSSMKQKGPRSNAREGRCCTKLSTRCSSDTCAAVDVGHVQAALALGRVFPPPATGAFVLAGTRGTGAGFAANGDEAAFVQLVGGDAVGANVIPGFVK